MPVYHPAQADTFEVHGSRFASFVRTERGADELCAWRLEVPAGLRGVEHRPSREEVVLILTGSLTVTLEGSVHTVGPGDVVHVPAGAELTVDGGPADATAWVTTTPGLEAVVGAGAPLRPPWAQ